MNASSIFTFFHMNYLFDDNENMVNYLDKVYPIGSIYMSTNSTSPATLFGGTWKALDEGRVLIGANSAYPVNSTGGEFEHTLTVDEVPSHTHVLSNLDNQSGLVLGATTYRQPNTEYYGDLSGGGGLWRNLYWTLTDNYIASTGGNQPHNNMQPYLAVYMWERTA